MTRYEPDELLEYSTSRVDIARLCGPVRFSGARLVPEIPSDQRITSGLPVRTTTIPCGISGRRLCDSELKVYVRS